MNIDSIFFLSALREKNAQLADAAYTNLLARAARDPNSDANTVSGLSSYLFTPFLYVTFERDGGANQNRQRGPTPAADVDDALRNNFLKVAFQILMQPLPAPDQDRTTSGQTGKYLIIKRLLAALRTVCRRSRARFAHANDCARFVRADALSSKVRIALSLSAFSRSRKKAILINACRSVSIAPTKSEDRDAIYADYAVALTGRRRSTRT